MAPEAKSKLKKEKKTSQLQIETPIRIARSPEVQRKKRKRIHSSHI
jgi:hypothetical protein